MRQTFNNQVRPLPLCSFYFIVLPRPTTARVRPPKRARTRTIQQPKPGRQGAFPLSIYFVYFYFLYFSVVQLRMTLNGLKQHNTTMHEPTCNITRPPMGESKPGDKV